LSGHKSENARYITHRLRRFRDGEIDTVEVTEEATTKFIDDVSAALSPTVWNTRCTLGISPTRTGMLAEPDDRDYHVVGCQ
jgi:hypothetical protein